MTFPQKFFAFLCLAFLSQIASAQKADEILATSTVATFKVSSLSANGQRIFSERRQLISDARARLLAAMISETVLDLESKALKIDREKLLAAAKAKLAEPTAADIKAVYDANREALGGRPIEEARAQIVEFIKHQTEDKAVENYVQSLRLKYKVTLGKDINSIGLSPTEVLATVGDRPILSRDFEQAQKVRLNDIEMEVFEELRVDLEGAIFSTLMAEEAKARNLDLGALIAAEITDKLREFSDEERAEVESEVMRRLFAKYTVKIQMAEPPPIVQNIAIEADDPQQGNALAAVTVVMFTDFQCPACARTHPVLKRALAAYGDRVRLVVRDFPLEGVHKDAFPAALAANAARTQGKFNEYTDILYRRQDALDKASLVQYAGELGLNAKQFELDFNDAKTAAEVRKDQADGRSYGIGGTPAIFVNGVKIHRLSLHGFRSAIDRALKK